jgi:5-methylcytosine-specific restriction enzyme A
MARRRIRGRTLQRIRAAQFANDCLCVACKARGIVRLASVSDHVVALCNGGAESIANRQLLCVECHDAKTREDIAFARGAA